MTGGRLARDISREAPKQHAFAVEARQPVPGRRGLLTRGAVLEESKRVRDKAKSLAEGRYLHEGFQELVEKGLAADEGPKRRGEEGKGSRGSHLLSAKDESRYGSVLDRCDTHWVP